MTETKQKPSFEDLFPSLVDCSKTLLASWGDFDAEDKLIEWEVIEVSKLDMCIYCLDKKKVIDTIYKVTQGEPNKLIIVTDFLEELGLE